MMLIYAKLCIDFTTYDHASLCSQMDSFGAAMSPDMHYISAKIQVCPIHKCSMDNRHQAILQPCHLHNTTSHL